MLECVYIGRLQINVRKGNNYGKDIFTEKHILL